MYWDGCGIVQSDACSVMKDSGGDVDDDLPDNPIHQPPFHPLFLLCRLFSIKARQDG
jgi:hypothetical protein